MSETERLARLIASVYTAEFGPDDRPSTDMYEVADAILAAGYQPPTEVSR